MTTTHSGRPYLKLAILVLLFLPLRLYNIDEPLIEMHNVRQTQTAMITRNLLQDNLNVLLTRIDWKGNEPGYFVQEFPLYNAIVAVFWKLFGAHDVWGRLVSLAFGAIAALYLYKITASLFSSSVAFWSVAFFAVCPISVFMSQAFMINMFALALALAATYYLILWAEKQQTRHIIAGSVCLTLSALTNNTVTFIFLFPLAYMFWIHRRKSKAFVLGFGFLSLLFLIANLGWYLHAANVNAIYYPENSGSKLLGHFFSVTRFSRFELYYYFRMAMYFGYFVLGLHGLVLLLWGARVLWNRKQSQGTRFLLWGLIGTVLYYVVFYNALVGHNYYTLPVVPIVAMIVGAGVANLIEAYGRRRFFFPLVVLFSLTYAVGFAFPFVHMHEQDTIAYEAAMAARTNTKPTDLVVVGTLHTDVAPGEMYPTILYYAARRGWNIISAHDPTLDDSKLDSLIQQGATYFLISFGQPERKPISSVFPFYKYFSHTVDIAPQETLARLKSRYQLVLETKNYALFRLTR